MSWVHSTFYKIASRVRPAKTQISLRISAGWSESSLSGWTRFGSLATHKMPCDQTVRVHRLIWVFAGRICNLVGNAVPHKE